MKRRTIIIMTGVVVASLGVAGAVSATRGGDDAEQPISGDALVRASEVALAHTGEGHVTDTEVGDEDSLYEVEVTLDSGKQVDVQLDENFEVVGSKDDVDTGSNDD